MDVAISQRKQFVLVHGAGHGAWCWYKLKPLLESAGHKVTAIDLSASGINTKTIDEVFTLHDYSIPLMELMAAIPANEKVILVGHSFGGFSLALAMDQYPEKISFAVFLTAHMPDTIHAFSYFVDKYFERTPAKELLDIQFASCGSHEQSGKSLTLGPQYLSSKLYQNCSQEVIALAKLLTRPTSLSYNDMPKLKVSREGYGSVKRLYITCDQDNAFTIDFQSWLVEGAGVTEVKEMKETDHMAMLSKPQELCQCLLEFADRYG